MSAALFAVNAATAAFDQAEVMAAATAAWFLMARPSQVFAMPLKLALE
jgi:hypothetical protein